LLRSYRRPGEKEVSFQKTRKFTYFSGTGERRLVLEEGAVHRIKKEGLQTQKSFRSLRAQKTYLEKALSYNKNNVPHGLKYKKTL
jgi:hypothetical protein